MSRRHLRPFSGRKRPRRVGRVRCQTLWTPQVENFFRIVAVDVTQGAEIALELLSLSPLSDADDDGQATRFASDWCAGLISREELVF
jgi:hypothetical protein